MVGKVHTTFVSLGRALAKHGETIERQANLAKITTAKGVAHSVMSATPVDVGTARSNWIAKRNSPPGHKRRAFAPGSHLGTSERQNLVAAYEAAASVFNAAKPGETLYLKNNLPYIARLNDGYSKQAPAGFVEGSIVRELNILRRVKLLV